MKALSVRQPYASAIASGRKTIEVRTWRTPYRGDLLICASAAPAMHGSGHALCIVRLLDCRPMSSADESAAMCDAFDGAVAWVLGNMRPVTPFPVSGRLGIFDIPFIPATPE